MLIGSLFSMFLGFLAKLPQAVVKGLFAFVLKWQLILLVPILIITWTVVSQHIDGSGESTGALKEFQIKMVGKDGKGGYFGNILKVAEDCGGKIFDPRAFFDCAGK